MGLTGLPAEYSLVIDSEFITALLSTPGCRVSFSFRINTGT